MSRFKVTATLSWEFESQGSLQSAMQTAQNFLSNSFNDPSKEQLDNFAIKFEMQPLLTVKSTNLVQLREFDPEEVFRLVESGIDQKIFTVNGKQYRVRLNNSRYELFRRNRSCVSCGIQGTKMFLETQPPGKVAHFNFYAEENGKLLLMTKDHILAKANGGTDDMENYHTMCQTCNNLKGAYCVDAKDVKVLREILKNGKKLERKELNRLIETTRLSLVNALTGF